MAFGWIGTVAAAVSSVASSFVASVSGLLATHLPRIATVLGNAENWRLVGNIVSAVARIFEAFRPQETVEEMGDRAMQGAEDGIRPENFDSWNDYVARIRDLELKPELSERYTVEEKTSAGLAVAVRAMEAKLDLPNGALAGLQLLATLNPAYFGPERLAALLRTTHDIASVVDYVDGKLGSVDRRDVEGTLLRTGQQIEPAKTSEQLRAELDAMVGRIQHPDQA